MFLNSLAYLLIQTSWNFPAKIKSQQKLARVQNVHISQIYVKPLWRLTTDGATVLCNNTDNELKSQRFVQ